MYVGFNQTQNSERGFTIIEMIVAVALFAVVMLVAIGALLSLSAANRKAQALQSVMNNLNIALDGMVRNIRMGTQYHCGPGTFNGDGSDDCSSGGTIFTFKCDPQQPACTSTWTYSFQNGALYRSQNGGTALAMTAPEVQINSITFYVVGTKPADTTQPKVLIVIKGTAGTAGSTAVTTFHIEATAVQRQLDLQ